MTRSIPHIPYFDVMWDFGVWIIAHVPYPFQAPFSYAQKWETQHCVINSAQVDVPCQKQSFSGLERKA